MDYIKDTAVFCKQHITNAGNPLHSAYCVLVGWVVRASSREPRGRVTINNVRLNDVLIFMSCLSLIYLQDTCRMVAPDPVTASRSSRHQSKNRSTESAGTLRVISDGAEITFFGRLKSNRHHGRLKYWLFTEVVGVAKFAEDSQIFAQTRSSLVLKPFTFLLSQNHYPSCSTWTPLDERKRTF